MSSHKKKTVSIHRKVLLTLVHHLHIHLLLRHHLLLQQHLAHVTPPLDRLVGRLVSLLLLLTLLLQLQLTGLLLLLEEIFPPHVILDLPLDLCDERRVLLSGPLDFQLEILDLVLNFLGRRIGTVMAFFMTFSLVPSIF